MEIDNEFGSRLQLPGFGGGASRANFADPFMMDAARYMPTTIESTWDYCQHVYYLNGNYRQAFRRAIAYFLTDLQFTGDDAGDQREQREFKEIMFDQLNIFGKCMEQGDEYAAYGNGFSRIHLPFARFLVDRREEYGREYTFDAVERLGEVKYLYREMLYEVTDPKDAGKAVAKRRRIKLPFRDKPVRDVNQMKIVRIDPRDIVLDVSLLGDSTRIVQRFSPWFIQKIQRGDAYHVSTVPMEFLEAISRNEDFMFYPGQVYHFRSPTISGFKNTGWGLPETLANYRNIHHLQVLRRIDEAVGMDYMLPFRVFSPAMNGDGRSLQEHLLAKKEYW